MDDLAEFILKTMFAGNFESGLDALARQATGSRKKALEIIRAYMAHFGISATDNEIDAALGHAGYGFEIEWQYD